MAPLRAPVAVAIAGVVLAAAGCSGDPSSRSPSDPSPSRRAEGPTSPTHTPAPARSATPEPLDEKEQRVLNEMLVEAAWDNDVRRARRLIDRGADVNWRDESVQSAFLIATSEGYLDLLELTLARGADVTLHDSFDGTGLIRAAERGHWDIVGRLLQTRIAVDHVNNLGWVALHEAIILGDGSTRYVDTVRALVAGGASLRITPERDGIAPVEHARSRGQAAVVRTLERALDAPDLDRPERSLLAAARTGDADAAAIALRQGADVDVRDGAGRTPLLIAVTEDRLAVARLLVAMGASPDALDDRHDTPWLVTGVTGSVPMAELLLRFDPDLTIRNRYGGVSIIPAAERGHVGYVRRMVQTRIDLDHVNDLGWTALLEAIILGDGSARYVEIVSILLDHGADPTLRDGDGVSPLEHARDRGYTAIARMLRRER
ncbi:MAG TPA: ankyrin repeat domain-containing protein [Nocardioides sp.]|nr:ankyrin repeat domain-containing protein [Nocardioides sp.]